MGADEEGTLNRLKAHRRELVDPKIREHHGRIVKTTGDGILVEFSSVVDAVRCAAEIQRAMLDRNAGTAEDKRITFRIGVNLGDVIVEGDDIYGDGVNIAARLEALAEPGGLCISRTVRHQIRDKLPYPFEDMGEQIVKNIVRPVRAYTLPGGAIGEMPPVAVTDRPDDRMTPTTAPRLSIVVLPFRNLSHDPEQEYFADGITDDLTTDLSRISGSFVIARNTAFTFKGQPVDVKQIGRELGVRYVLEGSVRRTGEQVRVNVQLIEAETGAHLWADRFDVLRAKLAETQDEIIGRLARSLNLQLVADVSRRIDQERAADPSVLDLVMRGWSWWYRPPFSAANMKQAQLAFERALEVDPESVEARIGLASVLGAKLTDGFSDSIQQDEARACQLLTEALERDPNQSLAHEAMGRIRKVQNRLTEARIEFESAIALDRNNARAIYNLGGALMFLGEPEAAIPHLEKAIRISPKDTNITAFYWALGMCNIFLGKLERGLDLLRRARAANPKVYWIYIELAGAIGMSGDLDEAKSALGELIKLKPEINSLARWRSCVPWLANPRHWALREKTVNVGLRRAGFPDE